MYMERVFLFGRGGKLILVLILIKKNVGNVIRKQSFWNVKRNWGMHTIIINNIINIMPKKFSYPLTIIKKK